MPIGLGGLLREIAPDLVHAHTGLSLTLRAVLSRRLDYCLVIDCHNSTVNTATNGAFRRSARLRFATRSEGSSSVVRHGSWRSALPSVTSPWLPRGLPASRVPIIPLGADCDLFCPKAESERQAVRAELGIPAGSFCVAHAGRLVPGKGIRELVLATASLSNHDPTVLIVGDLDPRVCQELMNAPVRIVHRQFASKVVLASFLAAADAGAWLGDPSITLIEAMAVGLPIVAARRPHYEALFGEEAPLIRTQAEACDRLLMLAADPIGARLCGLRNREIAVARHSWASIARSFESLCPTT